MNLPTTGAEDLPVRIEASSPETIRQPPVILVVLDMGFNLEQTPEILPSFCVFGWQQREPYDYSC